MGEDKDAMAWRHKGKDNVDRFHSRYRGVHILNRGTMGDCVRDRTMGGNVRDRVRPCILRANHRRKGAAHGQLIRQFKDNPAEDNYCRMTVEVFGITLLR